MVDAVFANQVEEKKLHAKPGMPFLLLFIALLLAVCALLVFSIIWLDAELFLLGGLGLGLSVLGLIVVPVFIAGLKILKPNEALVLTLFGKYYGTLVGPGFFYVHPFVSAVNPAAKTPDATLSFETNVQNQAAAQQLALANKKISLKAMTLNNDKQKINDKLGNPIIIGIVVIWRVTNTAKAVFNVDNFKEFLSIQCDSALRNVVRLFPYDMGDEDLDNAEKTLRGSSQEIAQILKDEIQKKVDIAGLEITEARITHLAYAPEIAAAMLQRQQASAIIDARKLIVEGAVGMVEMALQQLSENGIVELDEERKAAMVSNLLVVLCGNKDAQPIVNSGSIY